MDTHTSRNSLFAGWGDAPSELWRLFTLLITTCGPNYVGPEACLAHVLIALRDSHQDPGARARGKRGNNLV